MLPGILCSGPITGQEKNVKKIANPFPQKEGANKRIEMTNKHIKSV